MNWLKIQFKRFWIQVLVIIGLGTALAFNGGILQEKDEISKTKLAEKYNQSIEIKNNYQLDGVKLIKNKIINLELDTYKGEPKDEIKVTLGDENALEFIPNIELKRWNEVSFKIKPKGLDLVATKDKTLSFEADKIKFGTPKMSFEMYEIAEGEGGYKYIWFLNEKPASNIVSFDIESAGLNFYRQPPLTEEYQNGYSEEFQKEIVVSETQVKDLDGNVLVERPENVVGSYAVYHSTKGGMNDANGKDYKTGKAFHIYRPHLTDANGLEAWGSLHIENGIYSVEIPQEFLDKAVYPIKSNDTFGYTTIATASSQTIASNNNDTSEMYGIALNLATQGNVTRMSAGLANIQSGTDQCDLFFAIYREDGAGANSHSRVAYGEELNHSFTTTTADWVNINFSNELLIVDDYILAALGNGQDMTLANNQIKFVYDNAGSYHYYNESTDGAGSYATRRNENPWTETDTTEAYKYSIYATYTPSGGGSAPLPKDNIWWDE